MSSNDLSNSEIIHEFNSPVVSLSVSKAEEQPTSQQNLVKPSIDPRRVIIERREEGTWDAITRKCCFNTSDGIQKIYFSIGFTNVEGFVDGNKIEIERPLEIFVPSSQNSQTQEWVTATMRLLSLSARNGVLAKALTDLRQIRSENTIWYGKYESGKTRIHPSLISALAWSIQEELFKRGFLTSEYEEAPLDVLMVSKKRQINLNLNKIEDNNRNSSNLNNKVAYRTEVCPKPNCGGEMIDLGGCLTCLSCAYSKCD